MSEHSKLERLSWMAGIVGTVAALVGLVITFWPHSAEAPAKPAPAPIATPVQMQAGEHSTQIGQVTGGSVAITNQFEAPAAHAIPSLYGLTYDDARKALIQAGWIPTSRRWMDAANPDIQSGNGPLFWRKGYTEIVSCSGSAEAFCKFSYFDPQEHILMIVTSGEESADGSARAKVESAHLETPAEKTAREAAAKAASDEEVKTLRQAQTNEATAPK